MSKVIVLHAYAKDTWPVAKATVATGWLPGQLFALTSTGEFADIATGPDALFVGIDDDLEVSTPPTGSLLTGIYGAGTKFIIDHSTEVAAGSATRAYSTSCESASLNADLWCTSDGKFTATAPTTGTKGTGSVAGKMYQKPSADNSYGLGVIMRI